MRKFALFGAKNFKFFEIYGLSARTSGGGQCRQRGQFFAILCGRLLWMTPLHAYMYILNCIDIEKKLN